MKVKIIMIELLAILALFGFSVAFLSLYMLFYGWCLSVGFSFWGFICMMAALATLCRVPKLVQRRK